ncbi:MAG TPA: long-chain fatty acid--CoA ligase [Spirochaetota bacterium]|nr:long-chain fatty acid--CoA ligase [Spirochaetota bacterium]HPJ42006.1 long-chain fatty acid--CoA ligase [Spirochaetota bacterium]
MKEKDVYDSKPWLKHYPEGIPSSIQYEEICLHDMFERTALQYPDRDALIFQGFRMSYSAVRERVNALASFLAASGIKKGDVVAVLLPNMIQTVISYYAVLKLGAIIQMNNPLYTDRELEYQFNDSGAKMLITLDLLANRMIALRKNTKIERIIYTSMGDYLPPVKKLLIKLVGKKKGLRADVPSSEKVYKWLDTVRVSNGLPEVNVSFDDVAVYQYTGGTTGQSKGAILTHRNLCSMVQMYGAWFPTLNKGDEVLIAAAPVFHVLGMSAAMNLPMFMGWTAVMVPKPQPVDLLAATRKYRPTVCSMVPTMYVGMLQHPDLKKTDMSCYKVLTSGGSSLPVEVLKKFKELTGADINEGFGMTETSPQTHLNPFGGLNKPGSIGLPYPDTDVKIVDLVTGVEPMPAGKEGEMIFRGPQITQGYLNKPEETAKAIQNGWLHSGDIAYMDEDGYFFVVDRIKDLIISSGYNVYPREIEEILYEHPKIQKAAVIGIPDDKRGEKIKVFVVPNDGAVLDEKEVMDYCQEKLAKYKWPALIEIRSALPESNVGKILKKELRREEEEKRTKG